MVRSENTLLTMNNPIINIEGVNIHQMNHQVFSNINLKIATGEFLYLIGDTGSGKSSLLKSLYGEIKVSNDLILPHPKCHLRNFVLFPIFQIDPDWSHPIIKKKAQFLINSLSQKSRIEITRLQKNVIINQ